MKLKNAKVKELMEVDFFGNCNRFSRKLAVDPSHLYRFIYTGKGGGKKLAGAIMKYCKENSLCFDEFVEL